MARGQQRGVGRPRTAVLDRDRITSAALAVVDREGDFTLPELARRLGVRTASLYHHVDGRAGVIELLRARFGESMDLAPLELRPWDVALEAFFRSYREVFAAHPRVVPLLTTHTVRAPQALAAYDKVVELLIEAGFPGPQVMTIITAMENFVIGSALDLAAPEVMWEVAEDVAVPHLTKALSLQDHSAGRAERAFELGLQFFLESLRAQHRFVSGPAGAQPLPQP